MMRSAPEARHGRELAVLGAALGLLLLACGSRVPPAGPASAVDASPSPIVAPAPTPDPAALDVLHGWLAAQNAGDLEAAAAFFANGARLGPDPAHLVVANTAKEVIAVLEPTARCHHEIVTTHFEEATLIAQVNISGEACPFLAAGETSHEIEIPLQIVDGKIICTCRPT